MMASWTAPLLEIDFRRSASGTESRSPKIPNFATVGVVMLILLGCGTDDEPSEVATLATDQPQPQATSTPPLEPPSPDPVRLHDDALAALESGDSGAALDLGRRAIAATPHDPQTIFLMARILAARNRFPEAIGMLDRLAAKDPDSRLPAMGQTAQWLVFQGRWAEAEKRYRSLLEEIGEANAGIVDRMLSSLLLRQGRRLEAASHLRKLCRGGDIEESELRSLLSGPYPLRDEPIPDDELKPIEALGRARYEISQGNWQAAQQELEKSAGQRPAEAALRGRIYAHEQDLASLGAWLDHMPPAAKQTADYWFASGVHEAHRDNHDAAVRCFCEVVLRDPTDSHAYEQMSGALRQIGLDREADEASERAKLIQKTRSLANEMAAGSAAEIQKITTLVDLLDQLHRPFEALAWRAVKVFYERSNSELSDSEAMEVLGEINRHRLERIRNDDPEATKRFLLCGIDLDSVRPNSRANKISDGPE